MNNAVPRSPGTLAVDRYLRDVHVTGAGAEWGRLTLLGDWRVWLRQFGWQGLRERARHRAVWWSMGHRLHRPNPSSPLPIVSVRSVLNLRRVPWRSLIRSLYKSVLCMSGSKTN